MHALPPSRRADSNKDSKVSFGGLRLLVYLGVSCVLLLTIWYSSRAVNLPVTAANPSIKSAPAATTPRLPATDSPGSTLATVDVGSKSYTFRSDSIGLYPRISIPPQALVKIHVKANPRESIQEEVLDGGNLDNKAIFQDQRADDAGNASFAYQTRTSPGSYRVAIYRNGTREIFDFWVDNEVPPE